MAFAMLPSVSSSSENPNPSPLGLSDSPDFSQSQMDSIISSLLTFPDSPSLSIRSSFDRVLDNLLSSSDDSVQDQVIDRTLERFSLLLESTKRRFQKRATLHNSISWFLPSDLTIKVFSKLDTKSLMQVSACCTMLNKCAMDPLCYSHIDLTTAFQHADDRVLRTLINRSGKQLRSLKLGRRDAPGYVPSLFTNSCLAALQFAGNLLRSLHIYSIGFMYIDSLLAPLSACANLTDLKIVGVNVFLEPIIELLAIKCCLIEHLFLDNYSQGIITDSTIELFVANCTKLTSLTLLNFKLSDAMAQILVNGFHKLKYINLSNTVGFDGSFLRVLGHRCNDSPLETLILRNCFSLQESEVLKFLNSLIAGNFISIQYIDVSSNKGLACDGERRTSKPNFPLEKLKEERSDVTFVAEFPSETKRSLKLGRRDAPGYVPSLFTNSCLAALQFAGNLLRSLHIYSIGFMYIDSLLAPLSACANLTDLKIVGVNVFLEPIIELLAIKCCLIEHLFLDNYSQGIITYSTIELFVTNCPKLTSLTLLNFNLNEAMARIIFKGFRKLKYINLSKTFEIDGSFLRVLGDRCRESPLETLILRDCYSLQEGEVVKFLNSIIAGNFKSIRYIDVSSNNCLASNGSRRTSLPNFPLETLKKKRWDVTFVGDFPLRPRFFHFGTLTEDLMV